MLPVLSGIQMSPVASEHGVLENPTKSPYSFEKYDSRWELEHMKRLEKDPTVAKWTKKHSIRIPYVDDMGFRKTFEPDFLVEMINGNKEIHEVKGTQFMNRETQLKVNAAKRFCEQRKMVFRLISKIQI